MSVFAEFVFPVTAFPPGGRLGDGTDVRVELERVAPTGDTYHLWVVAAEYGSVVERIRSDPAIDTVDILDEFPGRVLVRLDCPRHQSPVSELLGESDAVLVDATGTADGWRLTLRFPGSESLTTFHETGRRRGLGLVLREVLGEGLPRAERELTPPQREAVETAFEAGYFEIPRRTTLAELAERLGLSEQAISERLRRGLASYLTTVLQTDEQTTAGDGDGEP